MQHTLILIWQILADFLGITRLYVDLHNLWDPDPLVWVLKHFFFTLLCRSLSSRSTSCGTCPLITRGLWLLIESITIHIKSLLEFITRIPNHTSLLTFLLLLFLFFVLLLDLFTDFLDGFYNGWKQILWVNNSEPCLRAHTYLNLIRLIQKRC